MLRDPITVTPEMTVREVMALAEAHGISGFPVLQGKLVVGIVTNRDLRFETRLDVPVKRDHDAAREASSRVREGATLAEGKALMHTREARTRARRQRRLRAARA